MEVTAEVGASKPITAEDVVGRAGHGPERASVPITAGTRRPGRARPGGRGAQCAGEPAQESLLEEEREGGPARALRAGVTAHGWGRGGMREGMEGLKIWVQSASSGQRSVLHLQRFVTGDALYTLG